jgi:hypothetical protein
MSNKELIEKARKDRERSLLRGTVIICGSGLFFMGLSLVQMNASFENYENGAYHLLFAFGAIVTLIGIFSGEKS